MLVLPIFASVLIAYMEENILEGCWLPLQKWHLLADF